MKQYHHYISQVLGWSLKFDLALFTRSLVDSQRIETSEMHHVALEESLVAGRTICKYKVHLNELIKHNGPTTKGP